MWKPILTGILLFTFIGLPAGIFIDLVAYFNPTFDPDPSQQEEEEEQDDAESLISLQSSTTGSQTFDRVSDKPALVDAEMEDGAMGVDATPKARRLANGSEMRGGRGGEGGGAGGLGSKKNRNSVIYAAESDPMLGSAGRQMPGR